MKKIFVDDPVMHSLHTQVVSAKGEVSPFAGIKTHQYFQNLAESIIGQQLSTKVADTIKERVKTVIGSSFTPPAVLAIEVEQFRQAGISYSKAAYLHNLAQAWTDGTLHPETWNAANEEEIIKELTQVKGIGRWTVEMFLIFSLGRSDVFSAGDYGLRRAVIKAYNLPTTATPKEIMALAEKWQPNRSLASRILWQSLELEAS